MESSLPEAFANMRAAFSARQNGEMQSTARWEPAGEAEMETFGGDGDGVWPAVETSGREANSAVTE